MAATEGNGTVIYMKLPDNSGAMYVTRRQNVAFMQGFGFIECTKAEYDAIMQRLNTLEVIDDTSGANLDAWHALTVKEKENPDE